MDNIIEKMVLSEGCPVTIVPGEAFVLYVDGVVVNFHYLEPNMLIYYSVDLNFGGTVDLDPMTGTGYFEIEKLESPIEYIHCFSHPRLCHPDMNVYIPSDQYKLEYHDLNKLLSGAHTVPGP